MSLRALPFALLLAPVLFPCVACGGSGPSPREGGDVQGNPSSAHGITRRGQNARDGDATTRETADVEAGTDALPEVPARLEPLDPPPAPRRFEAVPEPPVVVDDVELVRADSPLAGAGKVENKMMAHDPWGQGIRALAGMAVVPPWSAASETNPESARDVDVSTTWSCEAQGEARCAWGLAFPKPAKVRMIRLLPSSFWIDDEAKVAEVQQLRVHTDAGYMDAEFVEATSFLHVVLPEAVETSTVTLEVTKSSPGLVHLAEVEVFGTEGQPRPPLPIDPTRAWIVFERRPWGGKQIHGIRETALIFPGKEVGDQPRALGKATALYGEPGDRYFLVERMWRSTCDEQDLAYSILDTQTRRWIHVGKLAGLPATVHRHIEGLGFAVRSQDDSWIVVEDKGEIVRRRAPRRLSDEFAERPMMRGGGSVSDPSAGCRISLPEEIAGLPEADRPRPGDTGLAISCAAGRHQVLIQAARACTGSWTVHVLDESRQVVEKLTARKEGARSPRMQRGSHGELYLELSPLPDGQSSVVTITDEGVLGMLTDAGALAVRKPPACSGCDDAFVGPRVGL